MRWANLLMNRMENIKKVTDKITLFYSFLTFYPWEMTFSRTNNPNF